VSVSHSAKLSHTVGKSWLFSLKSCNSVANVTYSVVPHAEKLLGDITASVGTVENARDRSSRERVTDAYAPPGIYVGVVKTEMKEKELNKERMLRNAIERSSMARGIPLHQRDQRGRESARVRKKRLRVCECEVLARVRARVKARARVRVHGPARERPPGIRSIGCARARGESRVSVIDHLLSDEHDNRRLIDATVRDHNREKSQGAPKPYEISPSYPRESQNGIELNGNGNGSVDSGARNHHVTARQMFPTSFREIPPPSSTFKKNRCRRRQQMILKDKRRKPSKEDFAPRNRSKVKSHTIMCVRLIFCFIIHVSRSVIERRNS
ncbi:hypothetical protein ALC60_14159, partial [Trachymyrmex zeteki]